MLSAPQPVPSPVPSSAVPATVVPAGSVEAVSLPPTVQVTPVVPSLPMASAGAAAGAGSSPGRGSGGPAAMSGSAPQQASSGPSAASQQQQQQQAQQQQAQQQQVQQQGQQQQAQQQQQQRLHTSMPQAYAFVGGSSHLLPPSLHGAGLNPGFAASILRVADPPEVRAFIESLPDVIKLNVGGAYFTTSKETLLTDAAVGLRFSLLRHNGEVHKDGEGNLFVDANPQLFELVLDYLRFGKCILPGSRMDMERVRLLATRYHLPELEAMVANRLREVEGVLASLVASQDISQLLRVAANRPVLDSQFAANGGAVTSAGGGTGGGGAGGGYGMQRTGRTMSHLHGGYTPGSMLRAHHMGGNRPRIGVPNLTQVATPPLPSMVQAAANMASTFNGIGIGPTTGIGGGGLTGGAGSANAAAAAAAVAHAAACAAAAAAGGGSSGGFDSDTPPAKKKRYFEFAKKEWEVDPLFKLPMPLPDGTYHWPQVDEGDPKTGDHGCVRCKLCISNGATNRFTAGYRGGKKNALCQHQASNKEHKQFMDAISTVLYGGTAAGGAGGV